MIFHFYSKDIGKSDQRYSTKLKTGLTSMRNLAGKRSWKRFFVLRKSFGWWKNGPVLPLKCLVRSGELCKAAGQ